MQFEENSDPIYLDRKTFNQTCIKIKSTLEVFKQRSPSYSFWFSLAPKSRHNIKINDFLIVNQNVKKNSIEQKTTNFN